MKMIKRLTVLTGWLIGAYCFPAFAQVQDSAAVLLQVHPGKDRIYLRWAIDNPYIWSKSLQTEYVIERYTIKRNGVILPEQEKKIPLAVSAAPLENWESQVQQNNYAAIVAQAIYGEDFEVSGFDAGSISAIVEQSDLLNQRYSFALYAADMSFEAACLAGWGYEDRDVKPGEFYLYRVIPAGLLQSGFPVKYGFGYTGVDEHWDLPRPVDLAAEFGDRLVQLSWNTSLYRKIFAAYQVEKSGDNVHFEPLGAPYTPLDDQNYTLFADSLEENDKPYYYRLRGISIFGERSEPSDTVSGQGKEVLQAVPAIVRTTILTSGDAQIEWVFDEASEALIRSFDLTRSDSESGPYQTVAGKIPPTERSIIYKGLKTTNYFQIEAVDWDGKRRRSFPVLLMPVDSIPPAAPQQLRAQIDTFGIVRLQWKANAEPDMLGYKLYRGNRKGEEPIPLNSDPIPGIQYADTVDLLNLNAYVYYALKAFDTHYNQSDFSETIEVEKPLKVKPSSPVFIDCEAESGAVVLRWIPSPDDEVAFHTLYRREENATENRSIRVFQRGDTTTRYRDADVEGNRTYIYTMTASSKWQRESDPSPAFRAVSLPAGRMQALKNLQASIDREKKQIRLTWKPATPGKVKIWKIYRSENDNPPASWKEIAGTETSIRDDLPLHIGDKYNYMIIAVMNDGGISNPEKVTVNY
ncbi:MAG: hypothetical protein LBH19_04840 [Dysgonamonadaceae bacterium]|nr:hypothetical protein [Dysgonamonadaceae bacterium]